MGPSDIAGDGGLPDRLAIRRRLHDAVILQHVEHRRVARRDAAEFLGDRCLVGLHDQFAERAGMLVLTDPREAF
ncbi:hypothetical protein [Thauera sp. WB-2]|uniref:hypothetical protein n=1 Tax=Thauera sp. WB-2 TaxID=2897772 RepID=UPI003FCC6FF7